MAILWFHYYGVMICCTCTNSFNVYMFQADNMLNVTLTNYVQWYNCFNGINLYNGIIVLMVLTYNLCTINESWG